MRADCRTGCWRARAHRGWAVSARVPAQLAILVALAWAAAAQPASDPGDSGVGERPSVAVVPFRVHSAKPIDYLGETVSNLIRARLEASGEVRVLDPGVVQQQLGASPERPGDTNLRQLGAALDAGFVVSGSLTELAGRYSLDVRVTPAAIALRSHTLVMIAESDDDLLARVNDLADGVLEEVVGSAPAIVAAVHFEGSEGIEAGLRDRLRTRPGEAYDSAAIRDDLALLRADPAIGNASVQTERGPEGVVVNFRIVRAERIFARRDRVRGSDRIVAIKVRGNRRIESGAILARVATKPGNLYRPGQAAKDLREVHALGFFRDVRIFTERTGEGLVLIIDVEENPVVRQISISGNDNVDGDAIRDILTLTPGATLDYPLLYENRERIGHLYRAQGYYLAEVSYEVEPLGEASVGIHFLVDENKKLKLRDIQFTGNEHMSKRKLKEGFHTKVWRFWSYATSWFDRSGTYAEPLFMQDLSLVRKKYTDEGYLHVEIGTPNVIPSKDGLTVSVAITEGQQFRVGSIDVKGDETIDVEALREKLNLRQGDVFNLSFLTEDRSQLTEHYLDRGFFFADVTPLTNISQVDQDVDVIFQVKKGPLYFIRQIDISGNTITVDPVIRREIPMVEGQLYSQRAILLSKARVRGLGFFEEVDFNMEPTDEPEQLDASVNVVERPTGSFSFGAGYSSQDGLVLQGSLSQSNLFGRGYATQLSADIGSKTQRFFLSFTQPYAFGSDFSLGTTLFRRSVRFEDFDQTQTGVDLILGHALSEDNRSRGFARYSFSSRDLDDDTNVLAAGVILRELFHGKLTSSQMGLSFVSDSRNDRLSPTKGVQLGGSVEYSGLGFFSKYLRAEARAAWFIAAPRWLLDRSAFAISGRIGYTLPLNEISDYDSPFGRILQTDDGNILPLNEIDDDLLLPLSERYFLGGLGQFQLRGFKARSVGPRRPILRAIPGGDGIQFLPAGRSPARRDPITGEIVPIDPDADDPDLGELTTVCDAGEGLCNNLSGSIVDLDNSDVVGGNKFISASFEYRFPISETLGLQGLAFIDVGNAFAEGENMFDVTDWRYGTGVGVQWFSPFGPLAVILGFPLDKLSVEDSPVFEFSVGGQNF